MPEQRKLAAIMFTDIVGYSALMSKNEKKALQILEINRKIHREAIEKYNGDFIKEIGDGTLSVFQTSSDAVNCAVEIHNKCCNETEFDIRMGIHIGEIVVIGKDVFGDGVNVASRIEAAGKTSGIYISERVYEDIKNKTDFNTVFMGEKTLKNIEHPVKIYSITTELIEKDQIKSIPEETKKPKEKSIIVLPFENMSPEPEQEYFSDGLTEEIITDLSFIQDLLVISRNSSMTFKGSKLTTKEIAEKVNVHYVLEGSVRKAGNNLRIIAQLIDASNDSHLWAEKYSGKLDDVFDIQEKVSNSIAKALKIKFTSTVSSNLAQPRINDTKAYECWMKAKQEMYQWTENSLEQALSYLEKGLEIIGENVTLHSGMALLYFQFYNTGFRICEETLDKAEYYCSKAFQMNPNSTLGHYVAGAVKYVRGDVKNAVVHLLKSLEENPGNSDSMRLLAYIYGIMIGNADKSMQFANKSIEIDPLMPVQYITPGFSKWGQGQYKPALEHARKYFQMAPKNFHAQQFYALLLIYNNQFKEAFSIIDVLKKENLDQLTTHVLDFLRYTLQNNVELALQSLSDEQRSSAWKHSYLSWLMSQGYSILNKKRDSLDWLENTVNKGYINWPLFAFYDPFLENIREEERFKKLMEKVKTKWEGFDV